jgi:hypothetical protein
MGGLLLEESVSSGKAKSNMIVLPQAI